jgi:glycine/D-amino acid oxidase-like deaminating enzyme
MLNSSGLRAQRASWRWNWVSQGHPGHRQGRHRGGGERHRLRGGAQQLLPAGHARAHGALGGGLGERSQGLQLPSRRLHADQPGGDARGRRLDLPAAAGDRLRLDFIEGAKESDLYMKGLYHDWQAKGITSVLHEKKGGYANNTAAIYGLAAKAEALGVRVLTGVTVTGFEFGHNSEAVAAVETDKGRIACDQVVIGTGPWVRDFWDMLELPKAITVKGRDGASHDDVPMWRYWQLEEGVAGRRAELPRDQRRQDAAGDARRHRRAASFRRRRLAHHRGALGHLLQAGLPLQRRAGRRLALRGDDAGRRGGDRSLRARLAGVRLLAGLRAHVVLGPGALPQALRGQGRALQEGALGRHRLLHAGLLSRSSTAFARTPTSSPTPTTATR